MTQFSTEQVARHLLLQARGRVTPARLGVLSILLDADAALSHPEIEHTASVSYTHLDVYKRQVFNLFETRAGQLLVGTERGVYRRVGNTDQFEVLSPLLPQDGVPSLAEDRSGNIWVGTVNNGLLRLSAQGVDRFTSLRGLPNNRVPSLLVDREGSIWAGTNAGLLRLSDAPFSTWNPDQALCDDYVRTVYQHRQGAVWIGTRRGLHLRRNNKVVASYTCLLYTSRCVYETGA